MGGLSLVVSPEQEAETFAAITGVGALSKVAELVGADAALLFEGDQVESRIELAILRHAALTAAAIAGVVGVSVSQAADTVASMVRQGRLHGGLFIGCPDITGRLVSDLHLEVA